jgi:hypothetical protein
VETAQHRDLAPGVRPGLNKLRVGLFADSPLQPRWVIDAFARVAASEFATISAVVIVGGRRRLPRLVSAYGRLDRMAFGAEPAELAGLAGRVPHGELMPGFSLPHILGLDLDVAFALGDFDDTVLDGIARHGVWRFCFGADGTEREALAGFREVAAAEPVSGSGVKVRLAPNAAPRLAYESWSRTYPLSVARNRARLLHKTAEFAWRALRELHRSGERWLESCRPVEEGLRPAPGNARLIGDLASIGTRLVGTALSRALYLEQWFLAFRFGEPADIPEDLAGFTRIVPPKDRDWADPFAIDHDGRYYVFFEELPYATGKGHISMLEVEPGGRWSPPVRVLERDYHLSYPFLLEQDGALYMIPESAQNRSIDLYRCVDFPLHWRREASLLQGVRCVDATFHRAADRWWMFANGAPGESIVFDDELHVFHSERLLGDWTPHARNPVKSDARSARPAGGFYQQGDALWRPAQICVPRYGAGLSLNRVQRLTPHEYEERQVRRIVPAESAGILGLHTVNRVGPLTVIDAFARRRRL